MSDESDLLTKEPFMVLGEDTQRWDDFDADLLKLVGLLGVEPCEKGRSVVIAFTTQDGTQFSFTDIVEALVKRLAAGAPS